MRSVLMAIAVTASVTALAAGPTPGVAHGNHIRGQIVKEQTNATPTTAYAAPEPRTLGGAFDLIDHNGKTVTERSYPGRTLLVYFGYAGCREACPIALDSLSRALEELGTDADKVQPLFVDIDMAGPDLKGLTQFVGNFNSRLVGLTGSRKQMHHMLRIFKVRRDYGHPGNGKRETGPRIDHTTYVFVVGADGITRNYFYHNLPSEKMVQLIRQELK